jgi:multidrug transporter EmrE-like cation transporter
MQNASLPLIILAALLQAAATLLLRAGLLTAGGIAFDSSFLLQLVRLPMQPLFLFGLIFYVVAAVVWFAALSVENVSTSYPVLVGATFVFVGIGGILLFQEPFSLFKGLGIGLILAGIALMALFT